MYFENLLSCSSANYSRGIIRVFIFLLILGGSVFAQAPDPSNNAVVLELNKPYEGKVGAGKKQRVEITLTADQYAAFRIESPSIKLGITELRPTGDTVGIIGFTNLTQDAKFGFVAGIEGKYQIEVYASSRSPEGPFRITMVELRAATETEKGLQRARDVTKKGLGLINDGKNLEARPFIVQGMELREKLLGPESDGVAESLSYLSLSYTNAGDYVNAIDLKTRSLRIVEKLHGGDDTEVAQINFELGALYVQKGDDRMAETHLLRSVDILKRTDKMNSVIGSFVYGMLGEIAANRREFQKASDYFHNSLAVNEKLFGPDHYHLVGLLEDIATVELESGDTVAAESTAMRALSITEKQYGLDDWRDTLPLNDLGRIYCKRGDFVKAEEAFNRALTIDRKLGAGSSSLELETLNGLARVYSAQGMTDKTLAFQTQASDEEERFIELNLAAGSEREKLAFLSTLTPLVSHNVSLNTRMAPNDPAFRELALTTILRRKGRVQDFIAYGNQAVLERLSPEDRRVVDQFNDVTARLSSIVIRGPESITVEEYQKQVKALETSREQLELEINNRSLKYFRRQPPASIADVRKAIPDDAALIEFAAYQPYDPQTDTSSDTRYAAYVLRKTGEIGWKDLGAAADIDAAVAAMVSALRDPKRTDWGILARALDEKIMRPLRGLAGDAKHLLISPDGELNVVPFNALVDEEGKYQVERYSFTYLSSGRDLLRMQDQINSRNPPLVVGNPAYGEPAAGPSSERGARKLSRIATATRDISDTYFAPLSGTEQEARSITALFPGAKYLTGAQATETSLKQAKSPSILHIATHGFFLEDRAAALSGGRKGSTILPENIENPLLRSGLALAGANKHGKGDDDGLLTALEASGLDLWGTELVVLSACDTGLGEIRNGEGVYGLRRAFDIAGAESIVMSLWPVSDQITRDLMISYYKNLKQGMGRGEALRLVQIAMLKRPGRSHPFYWASFIQSGDWKGLPQAKPAGAQ